MNQDQHRSAHADNDRRGLRNWHEWEFDGRERRIILCVATSLELRPGHAGFDAVRLEKLVSEATDMMRSSSSPIDSIRIVPDQQAARDAYIG